MTTQGKVRSLFPRRLIAGCVGLRRSLARRRGFTYVESMIALAVLSLAGAALLTSVAAAVSSSNDSVYRSIGTGLADQLMDEIAAAKFPSGTAAMPGSKTIRSSFATLDDYSGWTESPPRTKAGEVLGSDNGATADDGSKGMLTVGAKNRAEELQAAPGFVDRFTRSVLVERLQLGAGGWTVVSQHTPHRRATVIVSYTAGNQPARTVAQVTRVFSSMSSTP